MLKVVMAWSKVCSRNGRVEPEALAVLRSV